MKIRFAELADRAVLIELALENQAEIPGQNISVDYARVDEALQGLFHQNRGTHCLLLAELGDGTVAGLLLGCVQRYFYSNECQAQLIQWFVRPSFRGTSAAPRLVKAFVEWARQREASEVMLGVTSGVQVQQTDAMLRRLGFRFLGGNYAVNLKGGNAATE